MRASKSLSHWERCGASLLVAQPFMDNLIERGEGCYLIDVDGRRILDLAAGQFCSILGHSHQKFIARLQAQLGGLLHLGDQYVAPGVLDAAQRLAAIAPMQGGKVIFLSTGSEANECAMRIAKAATGRTGMLGFSRGYYGISLATRNLSSISDSPGRVDFQPAPAGQYKLLTPSVRHCPIGIEHSECTGACLAASLEMLGHNRGQIAAVIVETIVSAGGMLFPDTKYLFELQARAREFGALFVVDEAQTGMGRCGKWFDIENHGLVPDILVVSKTAGNGYPVGAVIVSDTVAATLEAQGFMHLSSHQNDPLTAAAVHAVIDIVAEEGLAKRSLTVGSYFLNRLRELQQRYSIIHDVRGRGLMIAMELDADLSDTAFKFALLCEQRGVHITYSYFEPVIRFIPPLIITESEVDTAIAVLDEVLAVLEKGPVDIEPLLPRNPRSGPLIRRASRRFAPARMLRGLWNNPPKDWVAKLRHL
jgi:2,2-dialkylglycine decarboxylase (pyruvate)